MRIGVDACCWTNGRGYGRFLRELLPALASLAPEDDFLCLADERAAAAFDLHAPNVRLVTARLRRSPTEAAGAGSARSVADLLRMTRAVARLRPDVFFSPSVYTYFPLPPGLRGVVAIHDAIAWRFPTLTLPSRRDRWFWRLKTRVAVRQSRLVITVSDYSAEALRETLGIPAERIRVAEEAPAEAYRHPSSRREIEAAARRAGLPPAARWFTYVGGFNPHKRVDVLVRAHGEVVRRANGDPPHLLLVGSTDGDVFFQDRERIRAEVRACGTGSLVHWTGFVPDEDLRSLHAGSLGLALPSECEGFGLPAVEAAASGAPVVAGRNSPLPRLLEGGGIFVEPGDVEGLALALQRLDGDEALRRRLGARARERARGLTWERTAGTTLAALREAAA